MRLKYIKVVVLFSILYTACFCSHLVSAQGDNSEEITLTTYYPAPYGEYDALSTGRLIVSPYALPPAAPYQGEIFFADGTDDSYAEGLYVYMEDEWKQLGISGQDGVWIGGVEMGAPLQELWYTLAGWFNPAYGFTGNYDTNNWTINQGSDVNFSIVSSAIIRVTTIGDLTGGTYRIVYGGGTVQFMMGKQFKMQLYVAANGGGWYLADEYVINNPSAVDNLPCNFWTGNNTVSIPQRQTSVYVYNNSNLYILLRMHPMPEQLNWETELGPYYSTKAIWEAPAAGSPTFGITAGWEVNPNMLNTLAGSNPCPYDGENQFNDYAYSYYYLKILNTYAGGVISDNSIDVYKTD